MSVGAMSAEDDERFLRNCLIMTSDINQIADLRSPRCVALGRTGVGKSALLWTLENQAENVRRIDPESLSLNYISNSTILNFFEDLEVDLDLFYQLLWRHVLAVELISLKKNIHQGRQTSILDRLLDKFKPNPKKEKALKYLFNFGDKFWEDTEKRVREVVHHIEKSLEGETGFSVAAFKARLAADLKTNNKDALTETTEIINRAQTVVNSLQLQELNTVMDFLAEDVFADDQQKFYIIIDDLDTGWVHDRLRFKLVRALIETIKKFRKVRNLKIVIGLRADLLETVLANTASKGFQTEKYEDLFLRMRWNREDLLSLADSRISEIFKDQYQNRQVGFYEVFSSTVSKQDSFDYILARTLHRPRDVIAYLNECLSLAKGQSVITQKLVRDAEASYSRKRVRSIADEWREAFGSLETVLESLKDLEVRFRVSDVSDRFLENLCLTLLAGDGQVSDGVFVTECNLVASGNDYTALRRKFLDVLYIVGAIGVKLRSGNPYLWSYMNEPVLNFSAINDDTSFALHPMLFRDLNKKADVSTLVNPPSPMA
jgi:hypothetical protein